MQLATYGTCLAMAALDRVLAADPAASGTGGTGRTAAQRYSFWDLAAAVQASA